MDIYYDVIYNLQTEQICLLLCITIGHLAWKLLILLIESPHFLLKWLRSTLQNSLSRFQQSVLSDCNSFPRFTNCLNRTNEKRYVLIEETICVVRKLCFEGTNYLSIRTDSLSERIALFVITIYLLLWGGGLV